ncbi:unnamed protein product [Closterium sp. NIES-54]
MSSDYVVGDLKVGGNAQSITGSSFLHHTSFLWDFCSHRMALLQQPSRAPEYRQCGLHHTSFLRDFCSHSMALLQQPSRAPEYRQVSCICVQKCIVMP